MSTTSLFRSLLVTPLWTSNLSAPWTPMSQGVSTSLSAMVVGARDCPHNTQNNLFTLDIQTGVATKATAPISQIGFSPRAADLESSVAGVGWRGSSGRIDFVGPGGYQASMKGEPSFGIPAAITADGALAAFLFEPTPDVAHVNNRTGTLALVNASGVVAFHEAVEGQGSIDPWSVALSPQPSKQGFFTVVAIMGSISKAIDFDPATGTIDIVWTKPKIGPYAENAVAVSRDGSMFAITRASLSVEVYRRQGAHMVLVETIQPPSSELVPYAMVMSSEADALVIEWTEEQGTSMAVTLHQVGGANVTQMWQYERACPSGGGFDYVTPAALSVSRGGELVAVGSFGCVDQGSSRRARATPSRARPLIAAAEARRRVERNGRRRAAGTPNVVVLKGLGGDGVPLYEESRQAEVWTSAVDVTGSDGYVGFGSWPSHDGSIPSQLSSYHVAL